MHGHWGWFFAGVGVAAAWMVGSVCLAAWLGSRLGGRS